MKTPRCFTLQPVPRLSLTLVLLVAAGLGLGITPHSHAQTLLNGSFELPALGPGNEAYGAGVDWTAILAYTDTNGEDIGTTPYGTQWVDLWPTATVSQTISSGFTLNQVYTLSMACSDAFGSPYDDLLVTVSGGGMAPPASSSFAIPENTNLYNEFPFITYSVTFTPTTSDPVTITLGNLGQMTEGFLALDNVVLSGPSVVPEPSTWALMVGGAALLCLRLRRRMG